MQVYTFGSPRPGNRAFKEEYDRPIPDTWNVINDAVGSLVLSDVLQPNIAQIVRMNPPGHPCGQGQGLSTSLRLPWSGPLGREG